MRLAVALFALFIVAMGIAGVLSPRRLLLMVTRAQSRFGLHFLAGFRLLVGAALLLAAPSSRAPLYLEVLGWLSLLSGLVTPFVGARRLEAILAWWRERSNGAVRVWSVLVLLFGISLAWAVFPQGSAGSNEGRVPEPEARPRLVASRLSQNAPAERRVPSLPNHRP
jgi:hypothetical protein